MAKSLPRVSFEVGSNLNSSSSRRNSNSESTVCSSYTTSYKTSPNTILLKNELSKTSKSHKVANSSNPHVSRETPPLLTLPIVSTADIASNLNLVNVGDVWTNNTYDYSYHVLDILTAKEAEKKYNRPIKKLDNYGPAVWLKNKRIQSKDDIVVVFTIDGIGGIYAERLNVFPDGRILQKVNKTADIVSNLYPVNVGDTWINNTFDYSYYILDVLPAKEAEKKYKKPIEELDTYNTTIGQPEHKRIKSKDDIVVVFTLKVGGIYAERLDVFPDGKTRQKFKKTADIVSNMYPIHVGDVWTDDMFGYLHYVIDILPAKEVEKKYNKPIEELDNYSATLGLQIQSKDDIVVVYKSDVEGIYAERLDAFLSDKIRKNFNRTADIVPRIIPVFIGDIWENIHALILVHDVCSAKEAVKKYNALDEWKSVDHLAIHSPDDIVVVFSVKSRSTSKKYYMERSDVFLSRNKFIEHASKTANIHKSVEEIAEEVQNDVIRANDYYADFTAICLECSRKLALALKQEGYKNVYLVIGKFAIDNPDYSKYEDWNSEDFNSDEEMESEMYTPLHYWVEVDGNIVDITANQFNSELEGEHYPPIVYGTYEQYPRYIKIHVQKISSARQHHTSWLSPDGELIYFSPSLTHSEVAEDIVAKYYPKFTGDYDALMYLLEHGWVRVVQNYKFASLTAHSKYISKDSIIEFVSKLSPGTYVELYTVNSDSYYSELVVSGNTPQEFLDQLEVTSHITNHFSKTADIASHVYPVQIGELFTLLTSSGPRYKVIDVLPAGRAAKKYKDMNSDFVIWGKYPIQSPDDIVVVSKYADPNFDQKTVFVDKMDAFLRMRYKISNMSSKTADIYSLVSSPVLFPISYEDVALQVKYGITEGNGWFIKFSKNSSEIDLSIDEKIYYGSIIAPQLAKQRTHGKVDNITWQLITYMSKKAKVREVFYGWISPEGKVYNVPRGYTHNHVADSIIKETLGLQETKKQQGKRLPMEVLLDQGWLRVYGSTIEIRDMSKARSSLIEYLSSLPNDKMVSIEIASDGYPTYHNYYTFHNPEEALEAIELGKLGQYNSINISKTSDIASTLTPVIGEFYVMGRDIVVKVLDVTLYSKAQYPLSPRMLDMPRFDVKELIRAIDAGNIDPVIVIYNTYDDQIEPWWSPIDYFMTHARLRKKADIVNVPQPELPNIHIGQHVWDIRSYSEYKVLYVGFKINALHKYRNAIVVNELDDYSIVIVLEPVRTVTHDDNLYIISLEYFNQYMSTEDQILRYVRENVKSSSNIEKTSDIINFLNRNSLFWWHKGEYMVWNPTPYTMERVVKKRN
jgi:hypothetical protein